jgi:hypothetical protein
MVKIPSLPLLIFIILFISCSKGDISCFTPPEPVHMRIVDNEGNDLLNPTNLNGYNLTDMRLYYISEGKKTYSKITLDSIPTTKTYFLNTDISWNADKGRSFYLELSPTVTDNIYVRYDKLSDDHCGFYKFVEFRYNNVNYSIKVTNGNFQSFEIVK